MIFRADARKKTVDRQLTDEARNCLKSLNGLDYESRRDDLCLKREENTCEWILNDERYQRWTQADEQPIL